MISYTQVRLESALSHNNDCRKDSFNDLCTSFIKAIRVALPERNQPASTLGREVATLANAEMKAGRYERTFEAGGLAT
jgi:hypothetical protein